MSKPLRWLLRITFGLVALAAVVVGVFATLVHRHLPGTDAPDLPGLSQPMEVAFDARGVPTLKAANLLDSSRALGLLHARERFFQMELQRRAARGELAEILGKAALPSDELHRIYGFRQIADQTAARMQPDSAKQMQAYADGVNAWLEARQGKVALELTILGVKPRPWTPADSIATLLLMHEDLSSTWRAEQRIDALQMSDAKRRFFFPRATDQDVLLIPDAAPQANDAAKLFHAEHARLEQPGQWAPGEDRPEFLGSNNWVIGGSRTKSGKPILANDPHLALRLPNLWYAARIEWAGRFAQGVTLPGLPGVVIGHNDRVAWGYTNIGTDVQDLYREPPASERTEKILVKDGPAEDLKVKIGVHGPQVMDGLSLHWTAFDPDVLNGALTPTLEARDWKSFNEAFDGFVGAGQNVVYADVDGHIGWRATGRLPLRAPGDDGSAPLPATGHDWQGYLPQAEMPRLLDPASGRIVTANQRVIGTSFAHPVAASWANPSRARRIVELIDSAKAPLTAADVMRMQLDDVSPLHRDLAALLHGQLKGELATLLDGFDGSARADDKRMLVSEQLLIALRTELRTVALGAAYKDLFWSNDVAAVEEALREPQEAWTQAGLGDKAQLLARAQAQAEAALKELPAKTWGAFNMTRIHHPFGLGGGLLAWLFDPPQAEQSGCGNCIRVGRPAHGQSMRMVVDFADLDATSLVLPLGQSGHLGSANRLDQQEDWLQGDTSGRTRLHQIAVGPPLLLKP